MAPFSLVYAYLIFLLCLTTIWRWDFQHRLTPHYVQEFKSYALTAAGGFSSMNEVIGVTASISCKLTCSSRRTVSPERQRLSSDSSFSTYTEKQIKIWWPKSMFLKDANKELMRKFSWVGTQCFLFCAIYCYSFTKQRTLFSQQRNKNK